MNMGNIRDYTFTYQLKFVFIDVKKVHNGNPKIIQNF